MGTKARVTVTIDRTIKSGLEEIGGRYGLKLSQVLERAAGYYLSEIRDFEIAKSRLENPHGEWIDADEARRRVLED